MIKYKVFHWEFDNSAWSRCISAWMRVVGPEPIAEACGVHATTIKGWSQGSQPSMTNFIKVCDELSLDPRDFFTTSEA